MKTTYENFIISSKFVGEKPAPWSDDIGRKNYNHNKVTVKNIDNGKSTTFDFWCSLLRPELETESDLLDAFYCFVSDALLGWQSFVEFCNEMGYDSDSRKAEKIWKACEKNYNKFSNLTGYSLDMMYDFVNKLADISYVD